MTVAQMREEKPITISHELVREVWCAIKEARDACALAQASEEKLTNLLRKMQRAGMADWIPTIEEVIAAGPYELVRD